MRVRRENNTLVFSLEPEGSLKGVDISKIELSSAELAEQKREEITVALKQEADDDRDVEIDQVADLYELVDQLKETSGQLDRYMKRWNDDVDPIKKKDT